MGEGSSRRSGQFGSDFLSAISGRVESTFRRVGSKKSDPWTTLIHPCTNRAQRCSSLIPRRNHHNTAPHGQPMLCADEQMKQRETGFDEISVGKATCAP